MQGRWIGAALIAGLAMGAAGSVLAQQRQVLPEQPSIMNDEDDDQTPTIPPPQPAKPARPRMQMAAPALEPDPNLDTEDQLAPSQVQQPMPAAVPMPTRGTGGAGRTTRAAAHATDPAEEGRVAGRPTRSLGTYVVACSGVFGKDSSHVKLAAAFAAKNIAYTQVDTASGNKVMASVLFAKNPKRRLEVWWSKPESRSDTHLIVINGQSNWAAPGELRLGLTLAEVEKLNHKPFKLSGFNKDNIATLSDWNGGELAAPPGGCTVGISLRAAPTTSAAALGGLPADREFTSAAAVMRAANPTVSEILVAY